MATSGTYTFDPTFAEIIDESCERIGVDPSEITDRHIKSIQRSAEIMFSSWVNKARQEWVIEQFVQPLTKGVNSYAMPVGAISVTSMIIRTVTGSNTFDTEMFTISREDYLKIADKDIQGRPTQYFMDRELAVPTLYLWNTPENSAESIVYNYLRRLQDAGDISNTLDIPYRWFDAMCSGLAHKIYPKFHTPESGTYNSNRYMTLKREALESFNEAIWEERDKSPTRMKVKFTRQGRR